MYARVLVEIGVVNADLLEETVIPIGVGGAIVAAWALFVSFRRSGAEASATTATSASRIRSASGPRSSSGCCTASS